MATQKKSQLKIDVSELKKRFDYIGDGLYYREPTQRSSAGARFGSICKPYSSGGTEYRRGKFSGTNYLEHRLVWALFNGDIPDGYVVDHINHNGLDNRIENLRLVTTKQNAKNMPKYKNNKSGLSGVHFDTAKNKWIAQTNIDGKRVFLGRFDTIFDAACVRLRSLINLNYHQNHCVGG